MSSASASTTAPPRLRRVRFGQIAALIGLVALPLLLYAVMLHWFWQRGELGIDFTQTLLPAAETIAKGDSPYPAYGYPPLVAFALVPFAFLPAPEVLYTAVLALMLPASLWILQVRDWRCYGAAFLWGSAFHAIQTGNVSLVLLLLTAIAWRARGSAVGAGASAGLAIATKLICWPLLVWFAATRRWLASAAAVTTAVGVTAVLWGLLGFSGLASYPSSLEKLESAQAPSSYTIDVLLVDLGAPSAIGKAVWYVAVLGILGACIVKGRRGADAQSFAFAVLAAIIASPIVWLHSFVLLLAPVAILRPRFGVIWLLPVVLWFGSGNGNGSVWQTLLVLAAGIGTFVLALTPGGRSTRPA